ncbi:MAG TPA: hypothetical protein VKA91_05325 [Nitrososphaeraceae archaeon]|nr:hypothetical protein [Nitrososphaeraceae archaeon]
MPKQKKKGKATHNTGHCRHTKVVYRDQNAQGCIAFGDESKRRRQDA